MSYYRSLRDMGEGYSLEAMVGILRDRCRYLVSRGATLNNPTIPGSYFEGWECITQDHAARLREMFLRSREVGDPPPLL